MASIQYPTCVRHLKPRKDVRLRHYFLCDACCRQWTSEAFDGNAPLYEGEHLDGFCQLCNVLASGVRLRTWFLCDICHRVAASIGRNHVAEQALLDYWEERVKPLYPHLSLIQNDRSSLRPRRDSDESGTAPIDFLAVDDRTNQNVFGIEHKTGRSPVRGSGAMSQFQLDTSDCDCIMNEMRGLQIPAYVVHAHVLEQWKPPTMGFRVLSLWWSDVYRMTEHFKSIRMRRDEQRGAAYFGKRAFAEISTFPGALWGEEDFALVEQFRREGIPPMYAAD
jgi:hypothetical protein